MYLSTAISLPTWYKISMIIHHNYQSNVFPCGLLVVFYVYLCMKKKITFNCIVFTTNLKHRTLKQSLP